MPLDTRQLRKIAALAGFISLLITVVLFFRDSGAMGPKAAFERYALGKK